MKRLQKMAVILLMATSIGCTPLTGALIGGVIGAVAGAVVAGPPLGYGYSQPYYQPYPYYGDGYYHWHSNRYYMHGYPMYGH